MSLIGPDMAVGAGLMLGAASILSLGPNNLMLLREGLRGGHPTALAVTVLACYGLLLAVAFGAADVVGAASPLVRSLLGWFGLLALLVFSGQSLWAARPAASRSVAPSGRDGRSTSVRRALLVVGCNPLTYLELLIVPAALSTGFDAVPARLAFFGTLLVMSGVCAFGYAHGGRLVASAFRRHRLVRAFDATAGLLMAGAAIGLGMRLITVSS